MQARDIYKMVSARLQDVGGVRWPWTATDSTPCLRDFLNAALREVALQRPDAVAKLEVARLQPGPRQILSSLNVAKTPLSLLSIVRNMGANGATPGPAVIEVARESLDYSDTSWVAGEGQVEVQNYAYDKLNDPNIFWVSPPVSNSVNVYVELSYAAEPDLVEAETDIIGVPSIYAGPLEMWMLYLILSGDTSEANMGRAQHFFQAFYQGLGKKLEADAMFPVNVEAKGK